MSSNVKSILSIGSLKYLKRKNFAKIEPSVFEAVQY